MNSVIRRKCIVSLVIALVMTLCMFVCVNRFNIDVVKAESISEDSYSSFAMIDGAQIRPDDKKAIRFRTKISVSQLDALIDDENDVQIVTMITPARYLEKEGLNDAEGFVKDCGVAKAEIVFSKANDNLTTNVDDNGTEDKADDFYLFHACLFNVKDYNVTQDFAARSYLMINDEVVAYTEYAKEKNNESFYKIALEEKAKYDAEDDEFKLLDGLSSGKFAEQYSVTVVGYDGKVANLTATYGQPLYVFEKQIEQALNEEGKYSYDGGMFDGDVEYDLTAPITSDLTLRANMLSEIAFDYDPHYFAFPDYDDIKEGSAWRSKYEGYIDDASSLTTPEAWWKALYSVVPESEKEKVYYVKGLNNTDLTEVHIPETFDDGKNGKLPVKYIGKDAFSGNKTITKVFAPETLTELRGTAFAFSTLELGVFPGVKYLADIMVGEYWTRENFNNCASLRKLVFASGFKASGINFRGDTGGNIVFYICGEEKIAHADLYIGSTYGLNALATTDIYTFKAECSDKYWHFDENNEPQRNSNEHTYVEGKCKACGAHQITTVNYAYDDNYIQFPLPTDIVAGSAWRSKYETYVLPTTPDVSTLTTPEAWYTAVYKNKGNIPVKDRVQCYYVTGLADATATEITIPEKFNDGVYGELDVKYIGLDAFAGNKTLTKVFATTTLTELRGRVFSGCTALKVVVIPGVRYLASSDGEGKYEGPLMLSQNFENVSQDHIVKLVVGDDFTWSGRNFYQKTEAKKYYIQRYVYGDSTSNANWNSANYGMKDSVRYYFDETGTKDGDTYWHYENGEPVHNKHVDVKPTDNVDGICDSCGDAVA